MFRDVDPAFVDKFSSSIYIDDLISGSHGIQSAHGFYLKSKLRLTTAGFKLRKFVTNSAELHSLIAEEESTMDKDNQVHTVRPHLEGRPLRDQDSPRYLVFSGMYPTTKFFDPLGVVSPVTT